MGEKNGNLIVLIDCDGQDRKMKRLLKVSGLEILRQCNTSEYPIFYMLKKSENDYYAQVLSSVTWYDCCNEKHSLFDKDQPYTDIVSFNDFTARGGWAL